jgi:hypothetical protein
MWNIYTQLFIHILQSWYLPDATLYLALPKELSQKNQFS